MALQVGDRLGHYDVTALIGACEEGGGWKECKEYCTDDATFSIQAEHLDDMQKLQQYTDWMKGLLTLMSGAHYELRSFATDDERNNVSADGVFMATHTGEGRPLSTHR